MGWFSNRLHTRLTSRSGDTPARYSAKNCGYEGYDVIDFLFLCLETALAVRHHDELVATDTTAFAVHPHIRRITQTVTLVQMIARVNEYVLNVQSL